MAVWLSFQAVLFSSCACSFSSLPALSLTHAPLLNAERSLNSCPVECSYRNGSWTVVETANFQVYCQKPEASAKKLAQHAESLRSNFFSKWLGQTAPEKWCPKCKILLYTKQRSYVAAVGRGSERTVGSSLVEVDHGKITSRQIDLLEESTDYLYAALPHELTHVVLKDKLANGIPRWADEGMAILADTPAKQQRHNNDLQDAVAHRTTFHAAELLLMESYPPPAKFGVFYGQSGPAGAHTGTVRPKCL